MSEPCGMKEKDGAACGRPADRFFRFSGSLRPHRGWPPSWARPVCADCVRFFNVSILDWTEIPRDEWIVRKVLES